MLNSQWTVSWTYIRVAFNLLYTLRMFNALSCPLRFSLITFSPCAPPSLPPPPSLSTPRPSLLSPPLSPLAVAQDAMHLSSSLHSASPEWRASVRQACQALLKEAQAQAEAARGRKGRGRARHWRFWAPWVRLPGHKDQRLYHVLSLARLPWGPPVWHHRLRLYVSARDCICVCA